MSTTVTAIKRSQVAHFTSQRAFYSGMSGLLLLIVLMGFGRSLYLRSFFDSTPLVPSVLLHGIVLTAWFVAAFVQSLLVASRRLDVHRRFGWVVAGVGAAVLVVSTAVTANFLTRRHALGTNIEARIANFSLIVWGDIAALVAFALFFGGAIALRRNFQTHKRLMLLASMSILEPAMFRIWGWTLFRGVDRNLASLEVLLLLVLAMAAYDFFSNRRVHQATLVGGALLIGARVVALYLVADSHAGLAFIRSLF
jgi:hypothetical protein